MKKWILGLCAAAGLLVAPLVLVAQTSTVSPVRTFTCSAGDFVNQLAGTGAFSCGTPTAGSPGGSTGDIQYNNAGAFGGRAPSGNGTSVVTTTGTQTNGDCVAIDSNGNHVAFGAACGSGGGLFSQSLSAVPTAANTGLSTWINQGSATVSDSAAGVTINAPTSASVNVICRSKTAPATPYTITTLISRTASPTNNTSVGIGWYDGTNKLQLNLYEWNNTTKLNYIDVANLSTPTSFSSSPATGGFGMSQPMWLQMSDDGTNIFFRFSEDGENFLQVYTVAKASGFLGGSGYTNVAFCVNPQGSQTLGTLMSYTQ